jgi:hypothetical protein
VVNETTLDAALFEPDVAIAQYQYCRADWSPVTVAELVVLDVAVIVVVESVPTVPAGDAQEVGAVPPGLVALTQKEGVTSAPEYGKTPLRVAAVP